VVVNWSQRASVEHFIKSGASGSNGRTVEQREGPLAIPSFLKL